jgi:hypothetical protein
LIDDDGGTRFIPVQLGAEAEGDFL